MYQGPPRSHPFRGHPGAPARCCTAIGPDTVCLSRCARSSTDRASDYGSEGWGFESLRARTSEAGSDHGTGLLSCPYSSVLVLLLRGGADAGVDVGRSSYPGDVKHDLAGEGA